MSLSPPLHAKHTGQESGGELCENFKFRSSVSRRPQRHTKNLSTPEQFPSGTNLTKKPPRRLPSTASRVVCTSSPSPFVDVILHIGSLSITFQIQVSAGKVCKQCLQTATASGALNWGCPCTLVGTSVPTPLGYSSPNQNSWQRH